MRRGKRIFFEREGKGKKNIYVRFDRDEMYYSD